MISSNITSIHVRINSMKILDKNSPFQNTRDLKIVIGSRHYKTTELEVRNKTYIMKVPFRDGTFEHLQDNELYDATTFALLKSQNSPDTARRYINELEKFHIFLRTRNALVNEIDELLLLEYKHVLKEPDEYLRKINGINFSKTSDKTSDDYFNVIRSYVRYLDTKNVLEYNPARLVPNNSIEISFAEDELKNFTTQQWADINSTLDTLPRDTPGQRNRAERLCFCIRFAYAMGLRINEQVESNQSHIIRRRGEWFIKILGKGKRARTLRISSIDNIAIDSLKQYRNHLGLNDMPEGEKIPLLPCLRPVIIKKRNPNKGISIIEKSVTSNNWREQFKIFIKNDVMNYLYSDNEELKIKEYETEWAHLTPHSLRHTRLTDLVELGKNLLWVQKFAGHERLDTTSIYFNTII
ncbi:MAG: tyrosine-type recombinase/integrase [Pseudomonadota bacterium]